MRNISELQISKGFRKALPAAAVGVGIVLGGIAAYDADATSEQLQKDVVAHGIHEPSSEELDKAKRVIVGAEVELEANFDNNYIAKGLEDLAARREELSKAGQVLHQKDRYDQAVENANWHSPHLIVDAAGVGGGVASIAIGGTLLYRRGHRNKNPHKES